MSRLIVLLLPITALSFNATYHGGNVITQSTGLHLAFIGDEWLLHQDDVELIVNFLQELKTTKWISYLSQFKDHSGASATTAIGVSEYFIDSPFVRARDYWSTRFNAGISHQVDGDIYIQLSRCSLCPCGYHFFDHVPIIYISNCAWAVNSPNSVDRLIAELANQLYETIVSPRMDGWSLNGCYMKLDRVRKLSDDSTFDLVVGGQPYLIQLPYGVTACETEWFQTDAFNMISSAKYNKTPDTSAIPSAKLNPIEKSFLLLPFPLVMSVFVLCVIRLMYVCYIDYKDERVSKEIRDALLEGGIIELMKTTPKRYKKKHSRSTSNSKSSKSTIPLDERNEEAAEPVPNLPEEYRPRREASHLEDVLPSP